MSRVALLMSGASVTSDPDLRAVYVGAARALLTEEYARLKQAEMLVQAAERELVRVAKSLPKETK